MEFDKKNVLVVGAGKSGIASGDLLKRVGAKIVISDSGKNADSDKIMSQWMDFQAEKPENERIPVLKEEILLGEPEESDLNQYDCAVISPGVPIDSPLVLSLNKKKIPVIGEVELAYELSKGSLAGITGTNGKTTTTALVGEILAAYYKSSFVVGNIGIPYTRVALDTREDSVTVAEISSFQLESMKEFHPHVTAILNITPDHLNRHHTMETYIDTKLSITKNQTPEDVVVLNYEDKVLRERAGELTPRAVFFSSKTKLSEGLYLKDEQMIMIAGKEKETEFLSVNDLNLLGKHNYENVMAAVLVSMNMGVPLDVIKKAVMEFKAVEHRIEYVAERAGVKYYNDSKGTNPDAAIQGIRAMVRPTLLIGGGYDKGSSYSEWINSFEGKVRFLVLIGQTRDKIADEARECGFNDIIMAESLEEAVNICADKARKGDAVLLSPACASWGMFKNYEERGRIFKELVSALPE